jgi:hypothetical protein
MSPKLAAVTVIGRHLVPMICVSHVSADLEEVKSERLDLSQDAAQCRQVATGLSGVQQAPAARACARGTTPGTLRDLPGDLGSAG